MATRGDLRAELAKALDAYDRARDVEGGDQDYPSRSIAESTVLADRAQMLLDMLERPLAELAEAVANVDAESTGSPFRQAGAFAATNAARRLLAAIGPLPDPPEPEPRIVSTGSYGTPRPESQRYGGGDPLADYRWAKGER